MPERKLCTKCGENTAVIGMRKKEHGVVTDEWFCLKCAGEMEIGHVDDVIRRMGLTDEETKSITDEIAKMKNALSGFEPPDIRDEAAIMPERKLCTKCGKNAAIIGVQKRENGIVTDEWFCLKCAREADIDAVDDLIERTGLSAETYQDMLDGDEPPDIQDS